MIQGSQFILSGLVPKTHNHPWVELDMILEQGKGEIWVDNVDHPSFALCRLNYHAFCVGSPNTAISSPLLASWHVDFLADPATEKICRAAWGTHETLTRNYYEGAVPERDADSDALPATERHLAALWKQERDMFYNFNSVADFMESGGFGHVIERGGGVVSSALTAAVSRRHADITVRTSPTERGKGLARKVSQATVNESLRRNLVPHWQTRPDNIPSTRLADALGFRLIGTHTIFRRKAPSR